MNRSFDCTGFVVAAALLIIAGQALAQQSYPNRPIRMVIPYPPGGGNDIMGRVVAQRLTENLGVQVVVDNRGGGSGIIGAETVARSVPDGYTILVTSINSHLVTSLLTKTSYDPVKDFAPIGTIDASEFLMVVHPGVAANTLQEFIALAKSRPGQLNYATSTSSVFVTTEMFALRTGIKLQHVPYKGAGPALNDLLGGHVQMFFSTPSSMVSHVKSGKLKAIATTSPTRLAPLPSVPTFAESGVRGFDAASLRGILVAPATPKPIIDRLASELRNVINQPELREKLEIQGMTAFYLSPEQLAARMKTDAARFAQTIKAMNLKGGI
jgi:tripartite-type tricarboxylate transporter receptor subunit TctC